MEVPVSKETTKDDTAGRHWGSHSQSEQRRPRMTDRVTLITGASAGIGTELARVFASKGHRLALVDQRGDRLTTLASEIVAAGNPAPILIACDLAQPDAC